MPPTSELSPIQAGFRFLIEMIALAYWAIFGWNLADGVVGGVLAIAFPLLAMTLWGTFRVPGDESASGDAPVAVPGLVRMFIELDVLIGAAVAMALVISPVAGVALGLAVVAHYLMTLSRVRWLIAR